MAHQFDPAPIYVRVPTGHVEDAPDLSSNSLGLAHTFGSIDSVIARSPLLAKDPDAVPKILHSEYLKAEQAMFGRRSEEWGSLPETKREANRALFRHAVMKIEDFGAVAIINSDGVPCTHPGPAQSLNRVDEHLAYDQIDRGSDVRSWLKDGANLVGQDLETAVLVRDAAICEHNRWTMERALAQFVPTARPDRELRDDSRRRHNNMHDWFDLGDAETRRYDLVMLRVLLSQRIEAKRTFHKTARVRTMFLAVDGGAGTCTAHTAKAEAAIDGDVSELRLHLNGRTAPNKPADLVSAVMRCLAPHIDSQRRLTPMRIRFDFTSQPHERLLALANLVADELRQKLPETTRIEGFWNWRASGSPVLGVVGHRDLSAFGGTAPITERLRQTFMALVAQKGIEKLVTGYAPGTDQAAVEAWASLGLPKPVLIFPFARRDADGFRVYYTEDPESASEETTIAKSAAYDIGLPLLPSAEVGHQAQAKELLDRTDLIVFVVDETRQVLDGGSGDTLTRARQMQREILVIGSPP